MFNTGSYGLILDIFFLAFAVLTIFIARKKGFVLTLLDFAAFFLAVFLAIPVSGWLAEGVYNTFISQSVVTALESQLPSAASSAEIAAQVNAVLSDFPDFVTAYASSIGIDISEISRRVSAAGASAGSLAQTVEANIVAPIVTAVCKAIIFVILLIIFVILLKIAARLINQFFKLPVLKTLNGTLGAVLGVLKAAVGIVIICSVIGLIGDLTAERTPVIQNSVNDSGVAEFVNDHNPIMEYLSK